MPATASETPVTFTEKLIDRPGEKHRFYKWTPCPAEENEHTPVAGDLVLMSSRDYQTYRVSESPAGYGRSFTLTKADGSGFYDVVCTAELDETDRCDCSGFQFSRTCKHLDSIRDLIRNRQL